MASLKIGGKCITWSHFRETFNWDQQSCSLPLHEKLTVEHLDLDSASIMTNKLAEDVLDSKTLFLIQVNNILILCIWNNFLFIINKLINICQVTYVLCKYMCNQWINLNQIDVSDYFCYCIFIHHYNIILKLISILYLLVLQKYQEHNSNDASALDAVIEQLHHTSELVSLFNDKLFIASPDDARLNKLKSFYNWMRTGPMKVKVVTATSSPAKFGSTCSLCALVSSLWFIIILVNFQVQWSSLQ